MKGGGGRGIKSRKGEVDSENISFEPADGSSGRNCYFACGANRIPKRAPREMLLRENVRPSFMHLFFFQPPPFFHYLPAVRVSATVAVSRVPASVSAKKKYGKTRSSPVRMGMRGYGGCSQKRKTVDRYDFHGFTIGDT